MRADEQEYVLGEDVTEKAASKSRSGTMVLSVRLSLEEFAEIEAISHETGKTLSQIVREALRAFLHAERQTQPTITVSVKGGSTITVAGSEQQWGSVAIGEAPEPELTTV